MVFSFSSDLRHCLPLAVSASKNTLFLYAVASTRRCGLSSLQGHYATQSPDVRALT